MPPICRQSADNLVRFALVGGYLAMRSGPRRVNVFRPGKRLTHRLATCMRAKHKNKLCFIAYSTFSVQHLRQLQIMFPILQGRFFCSVNKICMSKNLMIFQ